VLLKTLFRISGHSQIALTLRTKTLDQIDVIQWWPSFAEASEGILFRATDDAQSCDAHQREAGWLTRLQY
jgi:hypothetical protein